MREISVDGKLITEPIEIANSFNTFFSEIANNIRAKIPFTSVNPNSYARGKNLDFNLSNIDHLYVKNIITSLETKTSLDIDDLNTKVLKKVAEYVSIPLAHIINRSFETGILPERLKISRTVPIFKAGSTINLSNYRPISCLPTISKIFERIVAKQLLSFVESNDILYAFQFGFQSGKSTVHPLIHIVDYISKAFNNDEFVIAVFLDLQKAFDLVDHDILCMKLEKIGVRGLALKWFKSYLSNRKQFVMVNGTLSDFFAMINISVLQGSILGPLLFLIFINDMHSSNKLLNIHFADDTSGLCKGKNFDELVSFVNTELQKLGIWLRSNKLAINASKTKIMIFHPKGKIIPDASFFFNNNDLDVPVDPDLVYPIERIHNNSVPCPAYKILGVYVDENLTFDYHIKTVLNKISKSMFSLNKVKNFLSTSALKSIYYALVHPHFLYCLPVVSCTSQKNINSLSLKQKRCIRTIAKSRYNAHSEPLFYELKILPFPDLILHQKLSFMHSIAFSYAPLSFFMDPMFPRNLDFETHQYPLRNRDQFFIPRCKNLFLNRFPLYSFSTCWNELDPDLSCIASKNVFKYKLKQLFLDRLSNFECNRLFCYTCST